MLTRNASDIRIDLYIHIKKYIIYAQIYAYIHVYRV